MWQRTEFKKREDENEDEEVVVTPIPIPDVTECQILSHRRPSTAQNHSMPPRHNNLMALASQEVAIHFGF